jgi:putative ABC transport system permease protein
MGASDTVMIGLLAGVLGGAASFVGVLIGAVFWVPKVAGWLGHGVSRLAGASAELAAVNSTRNPRRTAATTGALLIGVTLVALMSTGAATARSTLSAELDGRFPVDVTVGDSPTWETGGKLHSPPLSAAQLNAVRGVDGVRSVVAIPGGVLAARWLGSVGDNGEAGSSQSTLVSAVDGEAAAVLRDDRTRRALSDGWLVLSKGWFGMPTDHLPDSVDVARAGHENDGWRTVHVLWKDSPVAGMAPPQLLRDLKVETVASEAWVGLDSGVDPVGVVSNIEDTLVAASKSAGEDSAAPAPIKAIAIERAAYDKVINTLLAIVVGLLGVAVVIAVVGVANTLSLSVIERRRESATLRAIGMTRRQLRWSLATEGMVIAAVGAIAGVALGLLYGWAGARTVLGGVTEVHLAVPVADLAITLVVAVLAGLLASVLPARSAARSSPIAALATD